MTETARQQDSRTTPNRSNTRRLQHADGDRQRLMSRLQHVRSSSSSSTSSSARRGRQLQQPEAAAAEALQSAPMHCRVRDGVSCACTCVSQTGKVACSLSRPSTLLMDAAPAVAVTLLVWCTVGTRQAVRVCVCARDLRSRIWAVARGLFRAREGREGSGAALRGTECVTL
jgi:hypothetical protein